MRSIASPIKASKKETIETLEQHAAEGNFKEFKKLFEEHSIDINLFFSTKYEVDGPNDHYTFLRLALEYDIHPSGDKRTADRIKLVKYLLEKKADLSLEPINELTGYPGYSCEDLIRWRPNIIQSVLGFFFNMELGFGKNILPILKNHQETKMQLSV